METKAVSAEDLAARAGTRLAGVSPGTMVDVVTRSGDRVKGKVAMCGPDHAKVLVGAGWTSVQYDDVVVAVLLGEGSIRAKFDSRLVSRVLARYP